MIRRLLTILRDKNVLSNAEIRALITAANEAVVADTEAFKNEHKRKAAQEITKQELDELEKKMESFFSYLPE